MAALFNNNSSVVVSKDKNKSEKLCSKYKCNPSYKLLLLTVFSTGHVSVVRKKWEEWLLVVFFFHSQSCFCLALDLVLNLNINLKYCSLATRSNSKSWNHDVFEGLWGKVCVLVWLRGEKNQKWSDRDSPLQPESALWCWLALTSTIWPFTALRPPPRSFPRNTHTCLPFTTFCIAGSFESKRQKMLHSKHGEHQIWCLFCTFPASPVKLSNP